MFLLAADFCADPDLLFDVFRDRTSSEIIHMMKENMLSVSFGERHCIMHGEFASILCCFGFSAGVQDGVPGSQGAKYLCQTLHLATVASFSHRYGSDIYERTCNELQWELTELEMAAGAVNTVHEKMSL